MIGPKTKGYLRSLFLLFLGAYGGYSASWEDHNKEVGQAYKETYKVLLSKPEFQSQCSQMKGRPEVRQALTVAPQSDDDSPTVAVVLDNVVLQCIIYGQVQSLYP